MSKIKVVDLTVIIFLLIVLFILIRTGIDKYQYIEEPIYRPETVHFTLDLKSKILLNIGTSRSLDTCILELREKRDMLKEQLRRRDKRMKEMGY